VIIMHVAVVYESLYGNTRSVALAIADGLHQADPGGRVALVPVAEATPDNLAGAGLLVVGGPTHVLRMTSLRSRKAGLQAMDKAPAGTVQAPPEPGPGGPGVREWIDALPEAPPGCRAAAFDTRLGSPLAGGAARSIARRLRRRGYEVVARPQGFIVEGTYGPMRDGEEDRARAWGAGLVALGCRTGG
jgi:hypothetical protein